MVGNAPSGGGGAFGPNFVFSHNQAKHYFSTASGQPQYTDFIEVSIAEPVNIFKVDFGAPI